MCDSWQREQRGTSAAYYLKFTPGAHAGDDEEVQRDFWVAKVQHATIKSIQAVGLLLQELPMLEMRLEKDSRQQHCCREGLEGTAMTLQRLGPAALSVLPQQNT